MRLTARFPRSAVNLVAALAGIIAGAALYEQSSYRTLYQLVGSGRFITVTQPHLAQAAERLVRQPSTSQVHDVIIFGGSGAYHSISEDYIEQYLQSQGIEASVRLVSFPSQSFVDLLAMVEDMPDRSGGKSAVILAWSAWRFDASLFNDLLEYFSFDRSFMRSAAFEMNLADGLYDRLFLAAGIEYDWKMIQETYDVPSRGRVSIWLRYFLLDKIQKLTRGLSAYLFRDPPAFIAAVDLEAKNLEEFRRALDNVGHLELLRNQLNALHEEAEEIFSGPDSMASANLQLLTVNLLPFLEQRLRARGYELWLYELPIFRVESDGTAFGRFADEAHALVQDMAWPYPNLFYATPGHTDGGSADPLTDPFAWHDYVHTSRIGARVVSTDLAQKLATYLPNGIARVVD